MLKSYKCAGNLFFGFFKRSGAPEGIRIPDLRYRKPMLYPAELRAHISLLRSVL